MQSKNKFAICVYDVRCNTSYMRVAHLFYPLTTAPANQEKVTRGGNKNFKCDQWAMTKNRNIEEKNRCHQNIDVKTSMLKTSTSKVKYRCFRCFRCWCQSIKTEYMCMYVQIIVIHKRSEIWSCTSLHQ